MEVFPHILLSAELLKITFSVWFHFPMRSLILSGCFRTKLILELKEMHSMRVLKSYLQWIRNVEKLLAGFRSATATAVGWGCLKAVDDVYGCWRLVGWPYLFSMGEFCLVQIILKLFLVLFWSSPFQCGHQALPTRKRYSSQETTPSAPGLGNNDNFENFE